MYEEFFKLKEKPFNITPSHRFLYLSEGHKEALALLTYGVVERKGFILLTGDVGTGKTTVIQALLNNLGTNIECIHFSNPLLSPSEFINYLASCTFKRRVQFKSKADFLLEFEDYLKKAQQQQKAFVLMIDEAQTLSLELMEELRLLSNLEAYEEKLINIFLVGQPELIDRLRDPRCRALYQRIASRYQLLPMNLEETRSYVHTRLKVAGSARPEGIFSKGAIEALYNYSNGIPRVINILADNALLLGYSRGKSKISSGMIEETHKDMHLGEADTAEKTEAEKGEAEKGRDVAGEKKRAPKEDKPAPRRRRAFGLAFILLILLGAWFHLSDFRAWEFIQQKTGLYREPASNGFRSQMPQERPERFSLPGPSPGPSPEQPRQEPEPVKQEAQGPLLPTRDLVEESRVEDGTVEAGTEGSSAIPRDGDKRIEVKEGDYLARMAMNVYGRADREILELIREHNPQITDINTIAVGQVLLFPDISGPPREKIYTVHVASYRPGKAAQDAFRALLDAGYDVFIVPFTSPQKGLVYRVTIGNFKDMEGAIAYGRELLQKPDFNYANAVQLEMIEPGT